MVGEVFMTVRANSGLRLTTHYLLQISGLTDVTVKWLYALCGTGSMVHTALTFPSSQSMRNSIPDESEVSVVSSTAQEALLPTGSDARIKTHGCQCVSA
jgi:hypothetical protein